MLKSKSPTTIAEIEDLDPDLLEVLGADPSKSQELEISLQSELETRWSFWLPPQLEKEELDKVAR
jgi:hypothetical protein